MTHAKKLASLLLALVMLLALGTTAFAQEVNSNDPDNATITISNASKGETYTVYKLFDATVTGTDGGSISYTGTVPASLADYFEADAAGNITVKDAAYADPATKTEMSDGLRAALKTWAETATATATAESDGSNLQFTGLPFGYYVVATTQGEQAVTVTSTNPNATVHDKNSSEPKDLVKTVDNTDVSIGDTVTYTVSFKTANYSGAGENAKKITSFIIEDTLPDFLGNVTVTSIIVDDGTQHDVTTQFNNKQITLEWYDAANDQFLYKNGASVTITYTAVVTEKAAIDGDGNKNIVTLSWVVDGNNTPNPGDKIEDDVTVNTYAIALKKVDEKGNALSGAEFELPFYVKETPDAADNAYIYAGTTAGAGLTNKVTSPADGLIVIKGVKSGTYSITETKSPSGYNLLTAPFDVTAVKTGQTTTKTTTYLDENGNITATETDTKVEVNLDNISTAVQVIVNKTGSTLPSTGGVGTTMFYVLGGAVVVAAVVLLVVTKRKNHAAQ